MGSRSPGQKPSSNTIRRKRHRAVAAAGREESDIDLFFDYKRGKLGVFELMDVKEETSRILGRKADIMTRDSLHRVLRSRIEASALQVF